MFKSLGFRPRSSHLTGKDKFLRNKFGVGGRAQRNYDIYNSQLLNNSKKGRRMGQDGSLAKTMNPD